MTVLGSITSKTGRVLAWITGDSMFLHVCIFVSASIQAEARHVVLERLNLHYGGRYNAKIQCKIFF